VLPAAHTPAWQAARKLAWPAEHAQALPVARAQAWQRVLRLAHRHGGRGQAQAWQQVAAWRSSGGAQAAASLPLHLLLLLLQKCLRHRCPLLRACHCWVWLPVLVVP
jgi:hypothetical protein